MWTIMTNIIPSIIPILKNKNTWIIIGIIGVLGYYYIKVNSLENTILKQDNKIILLNSNLKTSKSNTKKCTKTNEDNLKILTEYEKDMKKVELFYLKRLKDKDILISVLRGDIKELQEPVDYPETIVYKDCIIKIKTKETVNETDKNFNTFNSLLNIGK